MSDQQVMSELENLRQQNTQLQSELQEAQEALQEQTDKYKELRATYRKLMSDYAQISETHGKVVHSRSWRMTWPLRQFGILLKKCKPIYYFGKAIQLTFTLGPKEVFRRIRAKRRKPSTKFTFKISDKRRREEEAVTFDRDITFSILVPLYNTPQNFLEDMIRSVQNQTYPKWELCLADGSDDKHDYVGDYVRSLAETDKRIVYKKLKKNRGIAENTNACIAISSGDYIALFDHDDLLHPSALFRVMQEICNKDADFVYTDEATFFGNNPNNVTTAHFKADFAVDTLRSYNYICHLSVFSRELMNKVGTFRKECDGSQDYDMILRLTEQAKNVVHIPELLYYWRGHKNSTAQDITSKPYIVNAAHKALIDHLERVGQPGTVINSSFPSTYRILYDIEGSPLISILIPNKDEVPTLDTCIRSIYGKTTYENFEVIIIENNSTDEKTFEYYEQLQEEYDNLRVVVWKDVFNYSAINNFGFKEAKGDYVILLNNDVEIITNKWIENMLMYAQRNDVGAVGAMLYYPDDTIQHAGVIVGLGGVAGHSHKYFPRGSFGYMARATIAQNLSAVTFACVMMRSDVYREVNGLDEAFKVAFNDVDMCMRIRKAGYLIVFTPYAELYHHESKSRGQEDTPEKIKRFQSEIERFKGRWGEELAAGDPYYNKNLTLNHEDFSFAD